MQSEKKLVDLGCGNGRDSAFFCRAGVKVTAVDACVSAIASIDKTLPILTVCDDFVTAKALFCVDYDYAYARFVIHAIAMRQQNELIKNVFASLKKDGLFFIEVRTVNDSKYGKGEKHGDNEYIFDDHYRRYIEPDSLKKELEQTGFVTVYFEESDTFSVTDNERPALLRIVAKKV